MSDSVQADAETTPAARNWSALRIDHIGVVIDDLTEAGAFLGRAFGLEVVSSVVRENLRADFFGCGSTRIEMIEIEAAEERQSRLGSKQSARIEHIAIEVDDLDRAIAGLLAIGVRFTAAPRIANGMRAVWTVPDSSDGVAYQLVANVPDSA